MPDTWRCPHLLACQIWTPSVCLFPPMTCHLTVFPYRLQLRWVSGSHYQSCWVQTLQNQGTRLSNSISFRFLEMLLSERSNQFHCAQKWVGIRSEKRDFQERVWRWNPSFVQQIRRLSAQVSCSLDTLMGCWWTWPPHSSQSSMSLIQQRRPKLPPTDSPSPPSVSYEPSTSHPQSPQAPNST